MVKEVTLDLANSMNKIVEKCFPKAIKVIDRFHVQKMASEAVQEMRIKYRWEAIDLDNQDYKKAKKEGAQYKPDCFSTV